MNRSKKLIYFWSGIALLALAFILNWSEYIFDEDDATTIAYHCFGRNADAEAPYNAYDSMFDYFASFLPPQFGTILHFGVIWTFLSIIIIYVLLSKLAANFLKKQPDDLYIYAFAALLAFPTYVYCELSIKTSMIGFSFLLMAHYLLVKNIDSNHKRLWGVLIISAALFGFGVSTRWNMCIYSLAIFADAAYLSFKKDKWKGLWLPFTWSIAAVIFFIGFLFMSGYTIDKFFEIMLWGRAFLKDGDFSVTAAVAGAAIFFTPIGFLAFVTGAILAIRKFRSQTRVVLHFVCSFLPFLYLDPLFNINIKFLITLFPAIFIFFALGSAYFLETVLKTNIARSAYWLLLLLPWFIGVQLSNPNTCWGPGYEVKAHQTDNNTNRIKLNKVTSGTKVKVGFKDGFAVSTPEGPMPVWGNFYVLFCGRMMSYLRSHDEEAMRIITLAKQNHAHVITIGRTPMFLTGLCKNGFTKKLSETQDGTVIKKLYSNGSDTIVMVRIGRSNVTNLGLVKENVGSKKFLTFLTYSHILNEFIEKAPANGVNVLEQPGPFSAFYEIQ